jgi:SAM-dependent methyltransferase
MKKLIKTILPSKFRLALRIFFFKVISVLLVGKRFQCNCCGMSFRSLLKKGNFNKRRNAFCPNCFSLERTRVLLFYLEKETDIFFKPVKLLHFAPEPSLKKIFKNHKNITYTNGDINPDFADEVIDITKIKYPENTFDYIICSHVLGHVPDESKAVKELLRVLKPDGIALLLTLIDWNRAKTYENPHALTKFQRLQHFSEPDLLRLHGADFKERISTGGFKVEMINYAEQLGIEYHKKFSLGNGEREIIFKCTKLF